MRDVPMTAPGAGRAGRAHSAPTRAAALVGGVLLFALPATAQEAPAELRVTLGREETKR